MASTIKKRIMRTSENLTHNVRIVELSDECVVIGKKKITTRLKKRIVWRENNLD